MEERLQKILSGCGVASRRAAEEYIESGRVAVNGQTAHLGDKADLGCDEITVDGVALQRSESHIYLLLNKPRGYVTTLSDEKGRRTVAQLTANCGQRVWPVGRLDLDSEGLLIMTDDGELTHLLTHPSHEKEKEYLATVTGDIAAAIPILSSAMSLDGEELAPALVKRVGESRISVIIHEGKNRQVRRMCAVAGLTVTALKRIREGNLALGSLHTGKWRALTEYEVAQLRAE